MVRNLSFQSHGLGSILGWRTEIPQAMQHGQIRRERERETKIQFERKHSRKEALFYKKERD